MNALHQAAPTFWLATLLMVSICLVAPPVLAQAPADTDAAESAKPSADRRVAVVALGEGARSGSVIDTLLELLDTGGFEVMTEERLRHALARASVPKTPPEVAKQFVGMTGRIANGIEKFFYKGNQSALEILTPVVNLGMAHLEVLARRPDFASQVFEAGLVMVRAYRNMNRGDDARRLARALVTAFPGFETDTDSVPPPIAKLLNSQRQAVASEGTWMKLMPVEGDGCGMVVNGTRVGRKRFAAAADADYFVTMECGGAETPLWRVRPEKGAESEVPIPRQHPLEYEMPDASFHHRKLAERYLQTVAYWADLSRVLGVTEATGAEADDSVVLVHVNRDGRTVWSDRADERTVSRMLARVMPDFDAGKASAGAGGAPDTSDEPTDWLAWSLVGTGAAITAAGVVGFVAADGRATELACSPDSPAEPTAAECAGVTEYRFDTNQELAAAQSQVTTVQIISGVGLAAGIGLAGWGTWRLLDNPESASGNDSVAWRVGVSTMGASVSARWRF